MALTTSSVDDMIFTIDLSKCSYNSDSGTYTYNLPQPIFLNINKGYQFQMNMFSIAAEIVNTKQCTITIRHKETEAKIAAQLPMRCLQRPRQLALLINHVMETETFRDFCDTDADAPFLFDIPEQGLNAGFMRFDCATDFHANQFELLLSDNLAAKLGFIQSLFDDLAAGERFVAQSPPNLNYGNQYVLVLVDVIENRIFNGDTIPLIDCFPLQLDYRNANLIEYTYVYSNRVKEYGHNFSHIIKDGVLRSLNFRLLHETLDPLFMFNLKHSCILLSFTLSRKLIFVG